MLAYSIYMS